MHWFDYFLRFVKYVKMGIWRKNFLIVITRINPHFDNLSLKVQIYYNQEIIQTTKISIFSFLELQKISFTTL